MKQLLYTILGAWILLSCSFGIQGVVLLNLQEKHNTAKENSVAIEIEVDGILFTNKADLIIYNDLKNLTEFFIFRKLLDYPPFLLLIITSCSFGLLGTCFYLIKQVSVQKVPIEELSIMLTPLMGIMAGVIILGIAEIVPTILVSESDSIRPITLVFMSFFAGLFIDKFLEWTEQKFSIIFKK